jgi:hypothetical protein
MKSKGHEPSQIVTYWVHTVSTQYVLVSSMVKADVAWSTTATEVGVWKTTGGQVNEWADEPSFLSQRKRMPREVGRTRRL